MVCRVTARNEFKMDSLSKNMYDEFKDDIWKELGPLDPEWFQVVMTETSTVEENISSVSHNTSAKQEGCFKTPYHRAAAESQQFSTPKVFRRSVIMSPEMEDEQTVTAEEAPPWKETQSPHLERHEEILDLLHTTPNAEVSDAERISESLGAHVDPDVSWTSSLNTPPAVSSTLILTKNEECPGPESVCAGKDVVFVRRLFPSLSVETESQKKTDKPLHQGAVFPETDQTQSNDSHHLQSPSGPSWIQNLPDVIEDEVVRSTVANVLDGTENILSIFFPNTSSSLRKVKTDRVKRRQIDQSKEQGCSTAGISTSNTISSTKRTIDQDPDKLSSTAPLDTGDIGNTLWSPLTLSEIPLSAADASCRAQTALDITAKQKENPKCSPVVEPPMYNTCSGLVKKKRKFIYSVGSTKKHLREKEKQSPVVETTARTSDTEHFVKPLSKAQDEAISCNVSENAQKRQTLPENYLPPSVQPKDEDLNMSQLCKDFAQDFSQMFDPGKQTEVTDTASENLFSSSACLSAMKQAKRELKLENSPVTNQNITERLAMYSGFQSAVSNVTHMATTFPTSQNGQSPQPKTEIHRATWRNVTRHSEQTLCDSDTNMKQTTETAENINLNGVEKTQLHADGSFTQSSSANSTSSCQVNMSLPKKEASSHPSYLPSGFKTASNNEIQISSAQLKKAKSLFEEIEAGMTPVDPVTTKVHQSEGQGSISKGSARKTGSNLNPLSNDMVDMSCQLTASQKADVTELCTLLEEADSQFDFTQVKSTKPEKNDSFPQNIDKELDPDFLVGIDFDDSFSAEAEKLVETVLDKTDSVTQAKTNCKTGIVTSQFVDGCLTQENCAVDQNTQQKLIISDGDTFEAKGFEKTKMDTAVCINGFQMASGKSISISAKAIQEADTFFEDCDIGVSNTSLSMKPTKNMEQSPASIDQKKNLVKPKHESKAIPGSEEPSCTFESVPLRSQTEVPPQRLETFDFEDGDFCGADGKKGSFAYAEQQAECLGNKILSYKDSNKQLAQKVAASQISGKTNTFELPTLKNGGFQTASGKGVVVSSAALKKARSILNECEAVEDKIFSRQIEMDFSVSSDSPGNGKSLAANGKPLQKTAAHFGDITSHAEVQRNILPASSGSTSLDCAATVNHQRNYGRVFSAASAQAITSADPLEKAELFFAEDPTPGCTGKKMSQNRDISKTGYVNDGMKIPASIKGGFQTASGKGVVISSAALKKAQLLLTECESDSKVLPKADITSSAKISATNAVLPRADQSLNKQLSTQSCATSQKCGPGRTDRSGDTGGGFCTASGKKVSVSAEALKKAQCHLNDMNSTDDVKELLTKKGEALKTSHTTDRMHFPSHKGSGFQTASGKGVPVSSEALKKAKSLLSECESDKFSVEPTHSNPPAYSAASGNCVFFASSGKTLTVSSEALQRAKALFSDIPLTEETRGLKSSVKTSEKNLKEAEVVEEYENKAVTKEEKGTFIFGSEEKDGSVSLGPSSTLRGCAETQQEFLSLKSLDSSETLSENGHPAVRSLQVTSERDTLHDHPACNSGTVKEQKGKGKRIGHDANMTGQPPSKRRLLEEFDRTADAPHGCDLRPQKSCPNSVLTDRRVFKYNVSPHPNITKPHGSGNMYVTTRFETPKSTQHLTSGQNRSTSLKTAAFVPPFRKNTVTEMQKNTDLDVNKTSATEFALPFPKQKTIVQEDSSKPQEEQNKHLERNTFIPPTKKINTENVADDERHEESNVRTLHVNHNLMNHSGSEGCGPQPSASSPSKKENMLSMNQDTLQNLENVGMARDMQDMRIRKKKRQTIKPIAGHLFLIRTSGVSRIPLKVALNGKSPGQYSLDKLYEYGVHQCTSHVSSETAESFRFSLQQYFELDVISNGGGVQLADGGWLIPSNDGTAGREEFYRALCDTPGVDPKLISTEWVFNHYRWIVWKQASLERSFPKDMGSICLTPEQVLLQLKYRYDVEIDHSRRPALRKIMEKDDTAAKTLVLCVSGIVYKGFSLNQQSHNESKTPRAADAKVEPSLAVVWLTDGWYAIKAQLDEPLTAMLHKRRLAVGGKLIISGAQLVGSQDACSPLEAPECLMLKICSNSTRPARWDTKLGYYRKPWPFLLPLSSLYSNGGPVGCVDITILRSYPVQWMERIPDGGVVFRCVRAEEKEARRYNSEKHKAMEALFAKIQCEFEQEQKANTKRQSRRRTMTHQSIASLQDGEELYEAVGDDPAYFEANLSERQMQTLQTYRRSLMEKKQAELQERCRRAVEAESSEGRCPKRDVTPVWRLCVVDSMDRSGSVYQLNFWRPSSDHQSLLKEGCRYKVYNLTTSEGKKRSGIGTVQLTGTKKTQFQDLPVSQEWLSAHFNPRVAISFVALQDPDFKSLCGEVDLTGFIVSVIDEHGSSPAFYLADGNLNFVKVRCFCSFAQSGLADVVKPHVLLALSNLQLRGQSMSPTPVVYAGDMTVFATNPKETHLQESFCHLRNLVQENFFLIAEKKLTHLLTSDGPASILYSPALQPRTPTVTNHKDAKTNQPTPNHDFLTPVIKNTPMEKSSSEKDPKSLKRRRALDYLSFIPPPPSLCFPNFAASPCVKKTFNPPRRSGTPSTLKSAQNFVKEPAVSHLEDEYVNDEELAMIDTQKLHVDVL